MPGAVQAKVRELDRMMLQKRREQDRRNNLMLDQIRKFLDIFKVFIPMKEKENRFRKLHFEKVEWYFAEMKKLRWMVNKLEQNQWDMIMEDFYQQKARQEQLWREIKEEEERNIQLKKDMERLSLEEA